MAFESQSYFSINNPRSSVLLVSPW